MKFSFSILFVAWVGISAAIPAPNSTLDHQNKIQAGREPRKRGISFNNPAYVRLFDDPNSRVFWTYNWAAATPQTGMWYEFVPMLWSNATDHTGSWSANVDYRLRNFPGATHVLSFNEPDQCGNGGSCIQDVRKAVDAHRKWVEPLRKYGDRIRLTSPAVTNGARDPNTGNVMGINWLKEFMRLCSDCKIDYVTVHWYDSAKNTDYFKRHVKAAYEATGRWIWITEFGFTDGSEEDKKNFLRQIMPWLDSQEWVFRYCMQWAAPGHLINDAGTGLSELGKIYNSG